MRYVLRNFDIQYISHWLCNIPGCGHVCFFFLHCLLAKELRKLCDDKSNTIDSQCIMNTVTDSPYCGFDEPQIVGVALMEDVELPCDVVSNPKKLVFHWSLNNSLDGTPLTSFSTNGSR